MRGLRDFERLFARVHELLADSLLWIEPRSYRGWCANGRLLEHDNRIIAGLASFDRNSQQERVVFGPGLVRDLKDLARGCRIGKLKSVRSEERRVGKEWRYQWSQESD